MEMTSIYIPIYSYLLACLFYGPIKLFVTTQVNFIIFFAVQIADHREKGKSQKNFRKLHPNNGITV
jgi:hypothetical protein